MHSKYSKLISLVLIVITINGIFIPKSANAGWIDDLKNRIFDRNAKIEQLQNEIKTYQSAVQKTQEQKQTLQAAVKELSSTSQTIETKIYSAENKIVSTEEEIKSLEQQIYDAEKRIRRQEEAIKESIRALDAGTNSSLIELLLGPDSMGEALRNVETIDSLQDNILANKENIEDDRDNLLNIQSSLNQKRASLLTLKNNLADQKKAAEIARAEKAKLLEQTKNQESEYQKLLNEKIKQKEQFEAELQAYESQLSGTVDQNKLPDEQKGILAWPVANPIITQQFGHTQFASKVRVYNGKIGHNGIDLGTRIGTAILSAESGVVAGTGNTDIGCPGGSYGRWILVKHDNGLATLYAHLSNIKVSTGERVVRGQTIGLSGNTGYSTGPHLHFTVFAAEVVQVSPLTRSGGGVSSCGIMPVAPFTGYLNPILYL